MAGTKPNCNQQIPYQIHPPLLVGHAFALSLSDMKEAQACIGHRAAGYLCDYMDKTMCVYPGTTCIQNYVLLDDLFTGN